MHNDNPDCEFCKIIRREAPARIVCTTNDTLAFFPLMPAARGHTLVVPRKHIADIWSLDPGLAPAIMQAVLMVSHALRVALEPDGLNLINSTGEAASQTIRHLHMHLVPRWRHDHIGDIWPPKNPWRGDALDEIAEAVRAACAVLPL